MDTHLFIRLIKSVNQHWWGSGRRLCPNLPKNPIHEPLDMEALFLPVGFIYPPRCDS